MSEQKPTLDYEPPPKNLPSSQRMVLQCISGCIVTMFLTANAVFVAAGIVSNVSRNSSGEAPAIATGILALGAIVAVVTVTARHNMKSPHDLAYGIGIWIGFGLVLLLLGLCFGVV